MFSRNLEDYNEKMQDKASNMLTTLSDIEKSIEARYDEGSDAQRRACTNITGALAKMYKASGNK